MILEDGPYANRRNSDRLATLSLKRRVDFTHRNVAVSLTSKSPSKLDMS